MLSDFVFEKTSTISKMYVFPSRTASLRRDDPAILCASHCFADMLCVPKDFGTPLVSRCFYKDLLIICMIFFSLLFLNDILMKTFLLTFFMMIFSNSLFNDCFFLKSGIRCDNTTIFYEDLLTNLMLQHFLYISLLTLS